MATEPDTSGPKRGHALRWGIACVALVLVGLIAWFGVREQRSSRAIFGTSVVVLEPTANTTVNTPTPVRWEVRAPVGASTVHTAIHWGPTSNPGIFGTDVAPADTGYASMLVDYASGMYALPRTFEGVVTFSATGTYAYRAHAIIDGAHYWSAEYTITVE